MPVVIFADASRRSASYRVAVPPIFAAGTREIAHTSSAMRAPMLHDIAGGGSKESTSAADQGSDRQRGPAHRELIYVMA